jgi:4-amino-4-deoxychorismate lyase
MNLSLEQGLYSWEDLAAADEIFLTNSIQELVPVTVLFDLVGKQQQISKGIAGQITKELLRRYRILTNKANFKLN